MRPVEAVFFDMDGLMFDTERIYYQSNAHVLNNMHVNFTEDDYTNLVGASGQEFIDLMLPYVGDMNGFNYFLTEADKYFRQKIETDTIVVKKGLFELLHYLNAEDIAVAVVSSSVRAVVETLLERTGAARYVDQIISADDVSLPKPHPEPYLTALDWAQVPKDVAWALEDSNNGILSAKRAGIKAIIVPDMAQPSAEVASYVDAIVDDLTEVRDYFMTLI